MFSRKISKLQKPALTTIQTLVKRDYNLLYVLQIVGGLAIGVHVQGFLTIKDQNKGFFFLFRLLKKFFQCLKYRTRLCYNCCVWKTAKVLHLACCYSKNWISLISGCRIIVWAGNVIRLFWWILSCYSVTVLFMSTVVTVQKRE